MAEPQDVDNGLLSQLNGASQSTPVASSTDDIDTGLLHQLNSPTQTPDSGVGNGAKSSRHNAPTRFQQSVSPADQGDPELSWADTGKQAIANFLPSLGGVGTSMFDAVLHPIDTATALGNLGKGAFSQAAGAIGIQQDPVEKKQNEALISALEDHYKTTYGSVKGLKKALATDPASVMMDAASIIPGFGEAADAAGLVKTAGVINKVGSAVDPIANAMRVAKLPMKVIAPVARQASSITTGLPASVFKLATAVGSHPDPAVGAAYAKFVTGQGDATEFQRALQGTIGSIKKDDSDAFMAQKGPMAQLPVNLTKTKQALADAITKANMGAQVGPVRGAAMKAINDASDMVNSVSSNPTLENVDALKQQLWQLKNFHPEVADNYINGIYHGARDDLVEADPAYAKLMSTYQDAMQNANDLTKTLGAGKNTAASAALVKNLRAMKTGTGENLLSQVMAKDPTIGGMLAGQALHPWHAGGRSMIEAMLAAPAAGAVFSHPGVAAAAVPASLIASSPRIAGAVNYGAGALGRKLEQGAPLPKAAYYAGRVEQEQDTPQGDSVAPSPLASNGSLPRNVRNNNAGNIIDSKFARNQPGYVGSDGEMAQFDTPEHGLDATKSLLKIYASTGRDTINKIVDSWAPASDKRNSPQAREDYKSYLSNRLGIERNQHIDTSDDGFLTKAAKAMAHFEGDRAAATGGRIMRASGGKVRKTHEELVQRLMNMAKQAKRKEDDGTKPLLNVPDNAIVKALDVAQQAI